MTAKEKAYELFNYYGTLTSNYSIAADCAIKVVDELFDFLEADDDKYNCAHWANSSECRYWCDVKIHLNDLRPGNK
jgi:L-rhamnose mutarotase